MQPHSTDCCLRGPFHLILIWKPALFTGECCWSTPLLCLRCDPEPIFCSKFLFYFQLSVDFFFFLKRFWQKQTVKRPTWARMPVKDVPESHTGTESISCFTCSVSSSGLRTTVERAVRRGSAVLYMAPSKVALTS